MPGSYAAPPTGLVHGALKTPGDQTDDLRTNRTGFDAATSPVLLHWTRRVRGGRDRGSVALAARRDVRAARRLRHGAAAAGGRAAALAAVRRARQPGLRGTAGATGPAPAAAPGGTGLD